ncbi:MAG: hypothetical protein NZT92_01545 [Abditibacteriales bacterium]|nr:hypothetical protein [Abditibacteriales bacterium]MDW8364596.1 enolase C-terminal domain-like protein [Abditibacteriales bacterium]
MKIQDIEIFWLDVPFHEVPERHMARTHAGWHISEICRVTTDNGLVGYGETLPNYTWGRVTPATIERAKGRNPFELMWDDTLGAGLQMACFDVAGKAAGVPVYRLLGKKVRDWCPMAWWAIDMSPEDFAREARDAVAQGYTAFKQKARPWWDVYEQARQTCAVIPPNFKLDYDFNGQLVNAATAVPVLKELDKFPNMAIYESPIPQSDVAGNRRIRQQTRCAIAMHYGSPPIMTALREEVCDGFVIGGGASSVLRQAHQAEEAHMPFWLQLVGTGWTTAFALHLGAVCPMAQWPAVTCLNLFVDQLITEPIQVKGGYARVPEAPGLGVEFNEASLKWQVASPVKADLDALYAVVRDSGDKTWYRSEYGEQGFWSDFLRGNQPLFEQGVRLETWPNDGSAEWQELATRAQQAPVRCRVG